MPIFLRTFLDSLQGSCFSFEFYKRIARQPIARSFLYLVLLSGVIILMGTGVLYVSVLFDVRPFLEDLSNRFPECVIQDGEMLCTPQEILMVDHPPLALAVYPGDDEKEIEKFFRLFLAKKVFVLTRSELVIHNSGTTARIPWSEASRILGIKKITSSDVEFLRTAIVFLLVPFSLGLFVFFFIWSFFQIVYFCAFGYLYSRISEMRVPVGEKTRLYEIFNMAVYASTPAALLLFSLYSSGQLIHFNLSPDNIQIIYMLMYAAFLIGGYSSYRKAVFLKYRRDTEDFMDDD
ncbi:MAG: DUF1189 family protein [Candidatus Aureabacteria bacterium]|nr:DUF1189 family protein [Candidatus Auribacterota bacterium]